MAQTLKFYAWERSPIYDDVDPMPNKGRLTGHVPMTVQDDFNPSDSREHTIPFSIMGPRDIEGSVGVRLGAWRHDLILRMPRRRSAFMLSLPTQTFHGAIRRRNTMAASYAHGWWSSSAQPTR
jgi:hypothetical protein